MIRALLLSAGLCLCYAPTSHAQIWLDNPDEDFRPTFPTSLSLASRSTIRVNFMSGHWIGRGRTTAPVGRTLTVPAGDWTDVRFDLDGLVELEIQTAGGATLDLHLDLGDTWTVSLADPDATGPLALDLALPAWINNLEQDLSVSPGDLLHDRFAAAVRDSAVLAPY